MIIESNIGNFGNYQDMYRFMTEEKIEKVIMTSNKFWGAETLTGRKLTLTLDEVKKIVKGTV